MRGAFPEAEINVPVDMVKAITCIPDPNDCHVLAAAICGPAQAIVTLNTRHFPAECVEQYGIVCQTPDEFLVHQFHLAPELVLQKLDAQAAGHGRERSSILQGLQRMVPSFARLVELGIFGTDQEIPDEEK